MSDHPAYRHDAERVGYANVREHISEAIAERYADRRLMRRLDTDRAYNNAEDADAQSAREEEIGREVWRDLEAKYIIDGR